MNATPNLTPKTNTKQVKNKNKIPCTIPGKFCKFKNLTKYGLLRMSLIIILADHSCALNYPLKKTIDSYCILCLHSAMNKQEYIEREKLERVALERVPQKRKLIK